MAEDMRNSGASRVRVITGMLAAGAVAGTAAHSLGGALGAVARDLLVAIVLTSPVRTTSPGHRS